VRSAASMMAFFAYILLVMGPLQRLVVFPIAWLLPARRARARARLLGGWIRLQARVTRLIVRYGAGVQIDVSGVEIRESCIVVMNHQSVLDTMIVLCEARGPMALILVRTRYRRGFPGISPYLRAARFPFISQQRATAELDNAAIADAARRAASGDATLVLFPEGHRTTSGEIGRFMPRGLTIALKLIRRPVYCIVGDGMWRVRTIADSLTSIAGTKVAVRVSGPFMPPEREEEIPRFIGSLRDHMVTSLRDLRTERDSAVAPPMNRAV
jgi:1-acyl-sn-glycerol-3-phosphate acyltransferase